VSNITIPNICSDPLVLLWIIIAAEADQTAMRRVSVLPDSLLRRKAIAYRILNQRISDPATQCLEATWISMVAAVIFDSRVSGPSVAHMHLKGTMQLLDKRGGLKSLSANKLPWGSPAPFVSCHYVVNDAGGIADMLDLKTYMQEFLQTLLNIQTWNKKLQEQLSSLGVKHDVPVDDPEYPLRSYDLSRTRSLATHSTLRSLLDPDYPSPTFVKKAARLSNLFNVNLTLWMFRKDYTKSALFLTQLLENVELSGWIDPVTSITSINPNVLVYLIAQTRREVDSVDAGEVQEQEIWISWMLIRALKLVVLMNDHWRRKIVQMMSGWLTGKEQEMYEISDDEIAELKAEITRNWLSIPR
jgi:hypothetical protein